MSIRKKLLLSIICFVIVPLFIVPIITYNKSKGIIEEKINTSAQQMLKQVSNNVDNVIQNMIASTNTLCLDRELLDILQDDRKTSAWQKYQNEKKVLDKIVAAQSAVLYPYNSKIAIFDFKGNMYWPYSFQISKKYSDVVKEPWYRKIVELNGYLYWMAPAQNYMNISDGSDKDNLVVGRLITDKESGRSCGVLIVSIEPSMQLSNFFRSDADFKNSCLLLGDRNGNFILSDRQDNANYRDMLKEKSILEQEKGSFNLVRDGQKLVVNYFTIPKTGWKLVQAIPYTELTKELKKLRSTSLFTNLLFFFIIMLVSYGIAFNITKPLEKLNTLMKRVKDGDFNIKAEIKGNDEVASLGNSFDSMVGEINTLIEELKISYEARSKIRLEALQAQINPHFLLNTLNGIKWMVTMKGDVESGKMISDLGYLLENTIGRNEEMIRLSEELKCLESYVSIQKMRYGDRFALELEIEEKLLDYLVPGLFLQPLVENCIIHGLEDKEHGGRIQILASSRDDSVNIRIIDNGKGMEQAEIERIMKEGNADSGRFTNIGVRNVDERIKLIFGKEYGIVITSHPGQGTTAEITLPPQIHS